MRRRFHTTVSVDIDLDDVLDDIDDKHLLLELESRGLIATSQHIEAALLRDAYDHLRANRAAAALAILDRLLFANVFEPAAKTPRAMLFASAPSVRQ